jgi:hypothetical protein
MAVIGTKVAEQNGSYWNVSRQTKWRLIKHKSLNKMAVN